MITTTTKNAIIYGVLKKSLIIFTFIFSFCYLGFSQSKPENRELWKNEPFGQRDLSTELIDKRDAFSKHFRNEDGTLTAHIAAGYINYFEDNQWKTIYHTIQPSATGFENLNNNHKTYYPETSTGAITTVLTNGAVLKDMLDMRMYYEVNGNPIQVQNIQSKSGSVKFNELTYANVYGAGIDLRLTQHTTKRKMDYIIQDAGALGMIPSSAEFLVFEEKIKLPNGWNAVLENNVILLKDDSDEVQVVYQSPDFYDEMVNPFESENEDYFPSMIGEYELIHQQNEIVILTKVPLEWLLDTNRNFPVVIDPTANFVPSSISNWTGTLDPHNVNSSNSTAAHKSALFASTTLLNNALMSSNDFIKQGTYRQSGAPAAGYPAINTNVLMEGWAKFNISSISHCSVVNSIILNANVTYRSANNIVVNTNLRAMANDPVAATAAARLTDIRDGSIYKNVVDPYPNGWRGGNLPPAAPPNTTTIITGGWRNFTLSAQAWADMVANLPSGWFGVGFQCYNTNASVAVLQVAVANIEIAGQSDPNKVYLVVDYGTCLPVSLTNFNANCTENGVDVNWTTATEHNSQKFIVEKSQDAENWREVAEVDAAGNKNSKTEYEINDNSVANGTLYYRLRQVDFDGQEEVFNIVSVDCDNMQSSMSVYPNPAQNSVTVLLESNRKVDDADLCVVDLNGRIVNQKSIDLLPGTNTVQFNDLELENGSYFVKVISQDENEFTPVKLMIQK